jgi:uncharacterized protein (DUF2235 family)
MGKTLVVCCDGTWNQPDEERHGIKEPTNVAKLGLAVAGAEADQRLFYEPGVGTTPTERIIGGAFGYGLSRNIRNCYRFLAREYAPGDTLFLFGFSRGAYTARSLAGLIRNCGILRGDDADLVDAAYAFYRDRTSRTRPSSIQSQLFREAHSHPAEPIHFIGVWDTVGALGIPDELPGWKEMSQLFSGWEELWGFHDTQLSSQVTYAIHGLSIDEQRAAFKPTLWTQSPDPTVKQTLKQVWFSGVHSEVGGGTDDNSLYDIALLWMADEARQAGLVLRDGQPWAGWPEQEIVATAPDYAGELHDSRHGFFRLEHPYHRLAVTPPTAGQSNGQAISSTATKRVAEGINGYAPPGFGPYSTVLGTPADIDGILSRGAWVTAEADTR